MSAITRERAERIAKAQPCENCGEYNVKRLVVKPATEAQRHELNVYWQAQKTGGGCGARARGLVSRWEGRNGDSVSR